MPGGDRTGPLGQGTFTGRGLGNCISYGIPAIAGAIAGYYGGRRGFGRGVGGGGFGRSFGRGFGWSAAAAGLAGLANLPAWQKSAPDDELSVLKDEAQNLSDSLKNIQARISEIEQK
ncbi:MAG: DUF5320 domain-containing protein [Candidatus Aenigmarchaeota archaeon]|nr:DUF5320 domain-containing protein [Candidatus Aenigmarchaeota archaeon]